MDQGDDSHCLYFVVQRDNVLPDGKSSVPKSNDLSFINIWKQLMDFLLTELIYVKLCSYVDFLHVKRNFLCWSANLDTLT